MVIRVYFNIDFPCNLPYHSFFLNREAEVLPPPPHESGLRLSQGLFDSQLGNYFFPVREFLFPS